jgi:hypothetical protein
MGKRKKVAFSNSHSKIDQVEEYYIDSEQSLNLYYSSTLINSAIPGKFIGYSIAEFDRELKARKEFLDRMCSLELLSSIEAHLRIDYLVRGQNKLKDNFSRKIREIYTKKENMASLVDDILLVWKKEKPEHKTRLDNLGKALDYRNWLAHGRYWKPKKHPHVKRYDYLTIYALATDILSNLELEEA